MKIIFHAQWRLDRFYVLTTAIFGSFIYYDIFYIFYIQYFVVFKTQTTNLVMDTEIQNDSGVSDNK